jgi:hypothetical protein
MMQGGYSMKQDVVTREIGWTLRRVLPLVPKDRDVKRSEFQAILDEILMCLHRNRKTGIDAIAEKTDKVLSDLAIEYGQLPEDSKSWESLIGYLYTKYLKELGHL